MKETNNAPVFAEETQCIIDIEKQTELIRKLVLFCCKNVIRDISGELRLDALGFELNPDDAEDLSERYLFYGRQDSDPLWLRYEANDAQYEYTILLHIKKISEKNRNIKYDAEVFRRSGRLVESCTARGEWGKWEPEKGIPAIW